MAHRMGTSAPTRQFGGALLFSTILSNAVCDWMLLVFVKVLADALDIRCRLERGLPFRQSNAQAVNLVLIDNEEVIVDLINQPGRLLRAQGYVADADGGSGEVFAPAPKTPTQPYWQPRKSTQP